jgi:predicted CoA-binding protein
MRSMVETAVVTVALVTVRDPERAEEAHEIMHKLGSHDYHTRPVS